jgi:hypothetical protein
MLPEVVRLNSDALCQLSRLSVHVADRAVACSQITGCIGGCNGVEKADVDQWRLQGRSVEIPKIIVMARK